MAAHSIFRFNDVQVDVPARRVLRAGKAVRMQRKPFDLLVYLLQHRERVVTKDEILERVWHGEHVSESSLTVCITKIRSAIGDSAGADPAIQTTHGYGYRFVADVGVAAAESGLSKPAAPAGTASASPAALAVAATAAPVLIGRSSELSLLRDAWHAAVRGESQAVFVAGSTGIGKTTLVHAFADEVGAANVALWLLRGDCFEQHTGSEPFAPLLAALTFLCRGPGGDDAVRLLHEVAPTWLLQLPGVVTAAQRVVLSAECSSLPPVRSIPMLAEALRRLCELRPLLLVLEDLHWCDPFTIDVISRLAQDRLPARRLMIGTYRPSDALHQQSGVTRVRAQLQVRGRCREIELGALDTAAVTGFITAHFPDLAQSAGLAAEVFDRTGGHPLFMHAVLDHVRKGGSVRDTPRDLRDMLQQEVMALGEPSQLAVQAASVIGSEFSGELAAAALAAPVEEIERLLAPLAEHRQIIEPAESHGSDGDITQYRFVHPLYLEVLAQTAARAQRALWHHRIAACLMAQEPEVRGRRAAEAAWHFEQAGAIDSALSCCELALADAEAQLAYARAATSARMGIALFSRLPRARKSAARELALRVALARAALALDSYAASEAIDNCERGLQQAQQLDDRASVHALRLALSVAHQVRGDARAALGIATEMVAAADPPRLGFAQARLGQALAIVGDFQAARRSLEQGIGDSIGVASGPLRYWIDAESIRQAHLGFVLAVLGEMDAGSRHLQGAIERARRRGHSYSLIVSLIWASLLHVLRRDLPGLAESTEEAARVAEAQGLFAAANNLEIFRCVVPVLSSPSPASIDALLQEIRALEALGIGWNMPLLRSVAAEALGVIGDSERGLHVVDEALAAVERGGERFAEAELHRVRGELLSRRAPPTSAGSRGARRAGARPGADEDEAEAAFARALAVARRQSAKWLALRVAQSLARHVRRSGRTAQAQQTLAEIAGELGEDWESADLGDG